MSKRLITPRAKALEIQFKGEELTPKNNLPSITLTITLRGNQPKQRLIARYPLWGSEYYCHWERYKKKEEIVNKIMRNDYFSIDVDCCF